MSYLICLACCYVLFPVLSYVLYPMSLGSQTCLVALHDIDKEYSGKQKIRGNLGKSKRKQFGEEDPLGRHRGSILVN